MANKTTNQQEIERILAETNSANRNSYNSTFRDGQDEQGTWITSQAQFDNLYKSVDEFEKILRS